MTRFRIVSPTALCLGLSLALGSAAATAIPATPADSQTASSTMAPSKVSAPSGRLIVQFRAPPLAAYKGGIAGLQAPGKAAGTGRLDLTSAESQAYVAHLKQQQQAFLGQLAKVLPGASVSGHVNEKGLKVGQTYQLLFNGMAVDIGGTHPEVARRALQQMDNVLAVHYDRQYFPNLHSSLDLINAPAAWALASGRSEGGRGIKLASMDGGIHNLSPMFDGAGWEYPEGYPLGETSNTNGKIIVSRAYFRQPPAAPPAPGEATPWPGLVGTSHGVHTASTAAGNVVDATYLGTDIGTISGVAPGAWVMSYRVFYQDTNGVGSFFTAEGLAALEDIVRDGADVVNNSWGGGPGSIGGEFDPLDQALINTAAAGVFVAMSNGNAGPFTGTMDHPSTAYINVAASTSGGLYGAGRLNVVEPAPVPEALTNIGFSTSSFGTPPETGTTLQLPMRAAAAVDAGNAEGCVPFAADAFAGTAALIIRGTCEFGVKVLNAENAGAEFVIVYNHAAGGNALTTMGPGLVGDQVTIGSVFVGNTAGTGMVQWHADNGDAAEFELDLRGFSIGNAPDVIANFSSRGPSAAGTLKPDIAAPGVSIIAQGYTAGATGEARHFGYGQVSGTSMAAPHVAGAAAVLKQLRPDWSNETIKSAMMSTSKYLDITNADGSPAQPLDMGAGRLNLEAALDPGVTLDPPSLSFGYMVEGSSKDITVTVTNIGDVQESYAITTVFTGAGFNAITPMSGVSVTPTTLDLAPGASGQMTVSFDSTAGTGVGDNQGFVVLTGSNGHEAHLPAWARVTRAAATTPDVLIIDNDASDFRGLSDYVSYYTDVLDDLGISYEVFNDASWFATQGDVIPHAAVLASYKAVIYFSGDYDRPNGSFTVKTPVSQQDMDRLVEYANNGGTVIAAGQDATHVFDEHFLQSALFGAERLADDEVNGNDLPDQQITPIAGVPSAFAGISLDFSAHVWVDHALSGTNVAPPATTSATGNVNLRFQPASNTLSYQVAITAEDPMTIIGAHLRNGAPGANGTFVADILPHNTNNFALVVNGATSWEGSATLTATEADALAAGQLYIAIFTLDNLEGELRANLSIPNAQWSGDGAANQFFIDSLAPNYLPLLAYPPNNAIVALLNRDQPSLEIPGIDFFGKMAFLGFGLEGVNDGIGATSRAQLLQLLLNWADDVPTATASATLGSVSPAGQQASFDATLASNITGTVGSSYRWDFGDRSTFTAADADPAVSHVYRFCDTFTARVEATDSWGNVAIGSTEVTVDQNCEQFEGIFADGFDN